ncbi:MAG TPA: decaprenyl-phosphate phosphoribosyltransferase [Corynebacteriales bacterium]|nr:decaprenyl-phosphate phosphoribosyltransferase [Mycobacteriales bacterium]
MVNANSDTADEALFEETAGAQDIVAESQEMRPPKNVFTAVIKAMRPRQWIKNVLVLMAPVSAGAAVITDPEVLLQTFYAFVAFCLASSSIYFINDARDVEADRAHPTKRFRPIASGVLPIWLAYVMGVLLMVTAIGFAWGLSGHALAIVIAVYIVLQLGYCFGLKHQLVLDIVLVSSGFLLRAIAGGVAADVPLSQWFLLVMAFGSLFMASGKRYAEKILAEREGREIRAVLNQYTGTYLRFVWTMSATALILSYCLWAFQQGQLVAGVPGGAKLWYEISMVPWTVAVMRYAVDVDRGDAGAPEDIALKDHVLQVIAVVWLVCIIFAVYVFGA